MRISEFAAYVLGFAVVCTAVAAHADDVKIKTEPAARYAKDLQVDDAVRLSCDWNAALVSKLVKEANGRVVVGTEEKPAGKALTLSAIKLIAPNVPEKRTNLITVRADVMDDGKLIATRDLTRDDSARAATPFCDALRALGKDLGDDVAEWLEAVSLPECPDNCPGIHPDDPILTGPEVQLVNDESIDYAVMQCGWTENMVKKVVKAFNEDEEPTRSKLQIVMPRAPISSSRKLTLQVEKIYLRPVDPAVDLAVTAVLSILSRNYVGAGEPQWISMRGELKDGDMLIGSFEAQQKERAPRMTSCGLLDNMSDNMSEKIVKWLKTPKIGAKL
jgi:hypothetical protein